ncbi:MAG: type VI secretion system tube protein Hcp [Planctomycetia bacterium]|nr:type VI secretion system tube protein Hcp [Planctomycetia bacterium]
MAGYIKFDGIDGEVQDKDHKNWTEIESFSLGIHKPTVSGATGSSRRRGDEEVSDMSVTKLVDKTSPKLEEACCNGKVFPKVTIHCTASYTDGGRVTYLAYELEHVQVTSYNINGHAQSEQVPGEQLSLNFEKFKVTYTENDEKGKKKGNVEMTWNNMEGKK